MTKERLTVRLSYHIDGELNCEAAGTTYDCHDSCAAGQLMAAALLAVLQADDGNGLAGDPAVAAAHFLLKVYDAETTISTGAWTDAEMASFPAYRSARDSLAALRAAAAAFLEEYDAAEERHRQARRDEGGV